MDHDAKASEEASPPHRSSENDPSEAIGTSSSSSSSSRGGKSASEGTVRANAAGSPPAGLRAPASNAEPKKAARKLKPNNVRKLRIDRMMSKAELARRANLSVLTIDRVEKGFGSRMNTKRKILEALGLSLEDRVRVFGEEE